MATPGKINRLSSQGTLIPMLGGGQFAGESSDSMPSLALKLSNNIDFTLNANGEIIFIDGHSIKKRGADGLISTIAGIKNAVGSIEEDPVAQLLTSPKSPIVNQHGEIFFIDQNDSIIRKIDVSGKVSTYAGNGEFINLGLAETEGKDALGLPTKVYRILFDHKNQVVFYDGRSLRLIDYNRRLSTLIGKFYPYTSSNNNYANRALNVVDNIMLHPGYGFIFTQSRLKGLLSWYQNSMPTFNNEEIGIPSRSGDEVYVFSARGKHLATHDAFSGAALYTFNYNTNDTLNSITDVDGLVTQISPQQITAPFGQTTTLRYTDGLLSSVTNPAGETHTMEYDTALLTQFVTPDGDATRLSYDVIGRLQKDEWSNGGGWDIESNKQIVNDATIETVKMTSAEGRVSQFRTKNKTYGKDNAWYTYQNDRENTAPDGTVTKNIKIGRNYSRTEFSNNTTLTQISRRNVWGAYPHQSTLRTSRNKVINYGQDRVIDADGLFPMKSFTNATSRNAKIIATNTYTHDKKTWESTSAVGQKTVTTVDDVHRPLRVSSKGLPQLNYVYNNKGQLTQSTVTDTAGTQSRHINYTYYQSGPANGYLQSVSNDLGQTTRYGYDAAGRVITQTLPDNRVTGFEYYADGELKAITPPNSQRHVFSYTSKNDTDVYQPPQLVGQSSDTVYRYNKDRQLTQIALPDGSQVNYVYDAVKGRLNQVNAGALVYGYHYNDTTGELIKLSDNTGNAIALTLDEPLLDKVDYRGEMISAVAYDYDHYWRLNSQTVTANGQDFMQRYTYAANDQLLSNNDFTLSYDSVTRQHIASNYASIEQTTSYDSFASPKGVQYVFKGSAYSDDISIDHQVVTDNVFSINGQIANPEIAYITVDNQRFDVDSQGRVGGSITLYSYHTNLAVKYYDSNNVERHSTTQSLYYSYPAGTEAQKVYRLTETKLYYSDGYSGRDGYAVYDSVAKTISTHNKPSALNYAWEIVGIDGQGIVYYYSRRYAEVRGYRGDTLLETYSATNVTPVVVTKSGTIYAYADDRSPEPDKANTYVIYRLTPAGKQHYNTLVSSDVLQEFAEDHYRDDYLLASFSVGYNPSACDGACPVWPTNDLFEKVVRISATETKTLFTQRSTGWWVMNSLVGSSNQLFCYAGEYGYRCLYPDTSNAGQYVVYPVQDINTPYYRSDNTLIGAEGNRIVHIVNGARDYPQLIDNPGKPDEVRALLLTDANIPPVKGTLTLASSGGDFTAYQSDYTYDRIGRISTISEARFDAATREHSYTYNDVGKLIEATTDGVTQTWQYDANGNRTHADGVVVAEYDAQDRLTRYEGNTYSYNPLGQLTQKTTPSGTDSYNYDVFGNLRGVDLANGDRIEYLIDPRNRRIGKKVNGVVTQKLLYQDQLNPLAELYPDNSVKNLFIYAEKSNVPSAMQRYDESGTLIGKYRIISNHLGSVVMVVNAETGEIAQAIDYDAWGNVLSDSNPNFQPFYFAGGVYDTDTQLTRFGARDYDAETGRWTAKDPIGFAGGLTSLYDYVGGDPVNFVDLTGRERNWCQDIMGLNPNESLIDNFDNINKKRENLSKKNREYEELLNDNSRKNSEKRNDKVKNLLEQFNIEKDAIKEGQKAAINAHKEIYIDPILDKGLDKLKFCKSQ